MLFHISQRRLKIDLLFAIFYQISHLSYEPIPTSISRLISAFRNLDCGVSTFPCGINQARMARIDSDIYSFQTQ